MVLRFRAAVCGVETAMADLFRLSDDQWAVMAPLILKDRPGQERKDDRLIISGILHVLTIRAAAGMTAPPLMWASHRPARSMVLAEGILDGSAHSLKSHHEAALADLGEKQELHRTDRTSNQDAHELALAVEPRIEELPRATPVSTCLSRRNIGPQADEAGRSRARDLSSSRPGPPSGRRILRASDNGFARSRLSPDMRWQGS